MKEFRIIKKYGLYVPQKRVLFFFWENVGMLMNRILGNKARLEGERSFFGRCEGFETRQNAEGLIEEYKELTVK